ncbi:hypothetical protein LZ554_000938 [Drepanopeziza brunnea f. sp. 'monogermtubi']|nr:hypothetical protein LZ554_000938 [Drepanopeziza brunnea f. sp. 'monogermtubi']
MQLSTIAVSLAFIASATAAKFNGFPSPLNCPTKAGSSSWTPAEIQALVVAGAKGTPRETNASNTSSMRCAKMDLPYYLVDLGKGAGTLGFAYDKPNDTYEFCFADGADLDRDGYPDLC